MTEKEKMLAGELYDGDIRKLFDSLDNDVDKIKNFIQREKNRNLNKKRQAS